MHVSHCIVSVERLTGQVVHYGPPADYGYMFQLGDDEARGDRFTFINVRRADLEAMAFSITSFLQDEERAAADAEAEACVDDDTMAEMSETARRMADLHRDEATYMGADGAGGNPDDRPEDCAPSDNPSRPWTAHEIGMAGVAEGEDGVRAGAYIEAMEAHNDRPEVG